MPPPIAADLRPCADGSAVRTALVACSAAVAQAQVGQTDRQTDGSRHRVMCRYDGGRMKSVLLSVS